MRVSVTVLQPDPAVPLDRFAQWLCDAGLSISTVELWHEPVPSFEELGDGVIVLGGRDNCLNGYEWMPQLHHLITQIVDAHTPLLGICLGHQILADALGGTVTLAQEGEEGAFALCLTAEGMKDPVLRHLPQKFIAAESHHDVVTALPPGATLLATSQRYAHQSFRVGSALGLQFHPEASPQLMGAWMEGDGHDPEPMVAEMTAADPDIVAAGRIVAHAFAEYCTASTLSPESSSRLPEHSSN
ncbi:type 1 glutamine amidotransferase [Corynebacterium anserum]|uniref:Type 1 glutamine amidotransferase n=1 Tax=Corynebacterium anserum TaxID=2684406 RepID=A0A7G7YN93_9CORY|nr:type 1 glutamine amidotransferase [Corynebacterium anserum]MBC2681510.1 type 1 glutamine amidotransferase [Corynebacterium anserum]QNH95963.1 type 1 glutamine amidotransferase [Corynebacterium anserum]